MNQQGGGTMRRPRRVRFQGFGVRQSGPRDLLGPNIRKASSFWKDRLIEVIKNLVPNLEITNVDKLTMIEPYGKTQFSFHLIVEGLDEQKQPIRFFAHHYTELLALSGNIPTTLITDQTNNKRYLVTWTRTPAGVEPKVVEISGV